MRLALLILALTFLCGPAWAQSAECLLFGLCRYDYPSGRVDQQTNPDQRGTPDNPLVVQEKRTTQSEKEAREKADNESSLTKYTLVLAVVTGVLALATAIVAGLTFLLWRGADKTAKRELRAYMGVARGAATFVPNQQLMVWLDIKNMGKTPAYKVSKSISVRIRRKNRTRFPDPPQDEGKWAIVPEAFWTARGFVSSANNLIAMAATGNKTVFAWGRIEYEDVFGTKQWMTFRYRLGAPTFDQRLNHVGYELDPCEEGNDASR